MKKFDYKGHQIEVHTGYNGDEVFITKAGEKVYSARVNKGEGINIVKWILT